MARTTTPELKALYVPVAQLRESKHNPRTHFDQVKLTELTTSIATSGILTPLTVRPTGDGTFEIGAGHRRFRAGQLANLKTIPCLIRDMDDNEFLELLNIENLQREDIHPLEEAAAYETMMKEARYTIEQLAARVGKSKPYIYDRVKLLKLTKKMRDFFYADRIQLGHAIMIARLTKEQQEALLEDEHEGLFQREAVPVFDWSQEDHDALGSQKARSPREVQAWINKHVRFDERAKDTVDLFPATAATIATTETVAMGKKHVEKVVHISHDLFIVPEVKEGNAQRIFGGRSWKRADGQDDGGEKSKTCERSVLGVIVVGPGRGEAFRVCLDKKKCEVHYGPEIKARKESEARAAKGEKVSRSAQQDEQRKLRAQHEQQQKEQDARRARWEKATPAILHAMAEKLKIAPTKVNGMIAQLVLKACSRGDYHKAAAKYMPLGKTADDVLRFAAMVVLVDQCHWYNNEPHFRELAKAFDVDITKVMDKAAPLPAAPKVEKKAPVKEAKKKK